MLSLHRTASCAIGLRATSDHVCPLAIPAYTLPQSILNAEGTVHLESSRAIVRLWIATAIIFGLSIWASRALHPPIPPTHPGASYYVGLFGLLAIGTSLSLTWFWLGRGGPASALLRVAIRSVLLLVAGLLDRRDDLPVPLSPAQRRRQRHRRTKAAA